MSMFVFRRKLTKAQCEDVARQVEEWFLKNPRRRICRADLWKKSIRKGHVLEDILKLEQPTEEGQPTEGQQS